MDIGHTIRCYTIEPLRDPIPHRHAEPEVEGADAETWDAPYVYDTHAEPTLTSLTAPTFVRRAD